MRKGSSFKGQRRETYEYGSYGSFRALFTFVTLPMNCVKWLWGQSAVHVPVYAYTYTSSSLISSKLSFGFMNLVQGFLKEIYRSLFKLQKIPELLSDDNEIK